MGEITGHGAGTEDRAAKRHCAAQLGGVGRAVRRRVSSRAGAGAGAGDGVMWEV